MSRPASLLLSLCLVLSCTPCRAEKPTRAEIGAIGKAATAFVSASRRQTGTAFCVHPTGLFLTNAHLIRGHESGKIEVVVDSNLKTQRVLPATVVRSDKDLDLALLRVEVDVELPIAPIGTIDEVAELSDVVVFGFPLGGVLKREGDEFPVMSVNTGNVSALRRKDGEVEFIQIDASVTFGSSGGPVFDDKGKVVGVVVSGVPGQRGLNLAIPASHVRRFLAAPDIRFAPPELTVETISQPVEFRASVASCLPGSAEPDLRLVLESDGAGSRAFEMVEHDGIFAVTAMPVVERPGDVVDATIRFRGGTVIGSVENVELQVGGRAVELVGVRRIELRSSPIVELTDGTTVQGELSGLGSTKVDLGSEIVTVDLGKAGDLTFAPRGAPGFVTATIIALSDGKEVGREERRIVVRTLPGADSGDWLTLGGKSPFPALFEPNDKMLADEHGLRFTGRHYVKTAAGDFLGRDFRFEVVYSLAGGDAKQIAFIGIGEANATGAYGEPKGSVFMKIHPPDLDGGNVVLAKTPAQGGVGIGRIGKRGTHRAIIEKRGKVVTLAIDVDDDGPTDDDLERIIPDITAFAEFLHGKNTHVFLGGGGTFVKCRLTELK